MMAKEGEAAEKGQAGEEEGKKAGEAAFEAALVLREGGGDLGGEAGVAGR
jgi:hypothetical protein